MMRSIIQLFGKMLAPASQKFFLAMQNPQASQKSVQQAIANRLINSEYGKFLNINSVSDWDYLPIVEYTDIQHWINGKSQIGLTSERILFYEKTSGSSGTAKLIPYPKSLLSSFNQMFCLWAHDLILHGPPLDTGKIYFCISPQFGTTTKQDITGLEDDSYYLDGWLRWILRPFLVSPPGINRLHDVEEFKQKLAQALLLAENLEIISIWSPSFLKVNLDYIQNQQVNLYETIKYKISPERAKLLLAPEIPWTELWPNLKLISCWDSVNAADRAEFLRSLFPSVMVQGKGLLATEAPMTIPLIAAQGYVPLLNEVFFEFEDSQGKIYQLHQIQPGIIYEIIISQKGGLYRYRIGDRVRVTHFYLNTPCLEFIGRTQTTSDLVGEKLHTEFVHQAIDSLELELNSFKSLIPVTEPHPHYILLLDSANLPVEAIAQRLDDALMRSHHYRQARLLGQLKSVRVLVSKNIPEVLTLSKINLGKKWGDLKHQILVTTPVNAKAIAELSNSFEF